MGAPNIGIEKQKYLGVKFPMTLGKCPLLGKHPQSFHQVAWRHLIAIWACTNSPNMLSLRSCSYSEGQNTARFLLIFMKLPQHCTEILQLLAIVFHIAKVRLLFSLVVTGSCLQVFVHGGRKEGATEVAFCPTTGWRYNMYLDILIFYSSHKVIQSSGCT
jgi:hypothetical protein